MAPKRTYKCYVLCNLPTSYVNTGMMICMYLLYELLVDITKINCLKFQVVSTELETNNKLCSYLFRSPVALMAEQPIPLDFPKKNTNYFFNL